MGGAPLVEQQTLGQQGAEDGTGELGEHVDDAVQRPDAADDDRRERDHRVEVPAADHAEHHDQPEKQERVDETDDSEIGPELRLTTGRNEQDDDTGDEEDQQQRADQLSQICG